MNRRTDTNRSTEEQERLILGVEKFINLFCSQEIFKEEDVQATLSSPFAILGTSV
jgi:hypothetical protein